MSDRYLPSLAYLRAFEATARHLSFTRAGVELNLTQTAISHRIRSLEELTGTRLFDRDHGEVRLTAMGRDYLETVRGTLSALSQATSRMIDRQNANSLAIATHINFGLKYLIPILPDFRRLHPRVALRLITVPSFEPAQRRPDHDVAIRYGAGEWPGMANYPLGGEECFPVCAPALAGAIASLSDLPRQTIIRTPSALFGDDWPQWLEAVGARVTQFDDEIVCDFLYAAVEAASSGLGVAMGRSSVVGEDIARGRLVAPFAKRLPLASGYHLVIAEDAADRPAVRMFREWLVSRFPTFASVSGTGPPAPA
ncbi:LysR substrate-binding domain-containing protein [Bosea sp. (in: a-proteobacteria)]|jgi:LysR family glycine cleavage system transcriptional activator|uniref:LysR substrate-binding domain-containing protein n=1 Tax=Bosea sp. (in: a-proteobacteria) TaxID=1871050 RepID=UPI002DDCA664|nr:LysR substrate-binding domain-containing protein [Bosea sp. (in: a-proteobacteria)]HEV2508439.1 LysR substrate-binding domain-containing protein [Bosea sp. (in: a-proteobacteria)]